MESLRSGIVNAVETVNAFAGDDALLEFRRWVLAPDAEAIRAAAVKGRGRGRKKKDAAGEPIVLCRAQFLHRSFPLLQNVKPGRPWGAQAGASRARHRDAKCCPSRHVSANQFERHNAWMCVVAGEAEGGEEAGPSRAAPEADDPPLLREFKRRHRTVRCATSFILHMAGLARLLRRARRMCTRLPEHAWTRVWKLLLFCRQRRTDPPN